MESAMEKKKASVTTLGCRVNQYESQACAEVFTKHGYTIVSAQENCDAYLINTCSVTAESDRKCRQTIRRICQAAQENHAIVILCGCHIQAHFKEYPAGERLFVCGNTDKPLFVQRVLEGLPCPNPCPSRDEMTHYDSASVSSSRNTRAFIKIEDGCDNFCTYCIVPHLRGPVRSRKPEEVEKEARRLAENGFREVVLTGIETSFYGRDLEQKTDLADLARRISAVEGIERIRFGSLRPTLFTEEFTRRLSAIPKILPHFHLSVQSGSDRILAMMKRDYGKKDILDVFKTVRRHFPDVTFSADLICGFPGELEADLEDSAQVIEKGMLLHSHVFPYSERPGTPAAEMRNPIPVHQRKDRCARLLSLGSKIARETIEDFKDREMKVLVEKVSGNRAYGYTENFIYTAFAPSPDLKAGEIVSVILTGDADRKPSLWVAKAKLKG